ncbi:MAG: PilZ domain-containing protein [Planctomycetes bacterium]|nr:PilZ domain-containing protein [Planctomycetota bacterium]
MPRTVLVADPDPAAALAFGAALKGTDYVYAGAVNNGKALIDAVFAVGPWAVAADISLPDHPQAPSVGWVATFHHLREVAPFVHTLATCIPAQLGLVPASIGGGARAFAEKPYLKTEILAALDRLDTQLPPQPFFARSRRVPRTLALRFRQTAAGGGTTITKVGLVRNMSETGLRIALPEPIAPRTVLFADIELPDRSVIRGRGQIVREALVDRGARIFEYGLALFDVETAHRAKLKEFISRVLAGDPIATGDTTRYLPELKGGAITPARR